MRKNCKENWTGRKQQPSRHSAVPATIKAFSNTSNHQGIQQCQQPSRQCNRTPKQTAFAKSWKALN